MPPDNRSRVEENRGTDRIPARAHRLVQIAKRSIRARVVEPIRQPVHEQPSGAWRTGSRGPHFPVAFRLRVTVVERHAEDLTDGRVPGGLHVVDRLRDDVEGKEFVRVGVVEEAVGGAPFVGEDGVAARGVDGEVFPLREVRGCGRGEFGGVGGLVDDGGDGGHGLDSDDTFDGEIGLIGKLTGEIVCGDVLVVCSGVLWE